MGRWRCSEASKSNAAITRAVKMPNPPRRCGFSVRSRGTHFEDCRATHLAPAFVRALVFISSTLGLTACGNADVAQPEQPPSVPASFRAMTFNVLCSFCGGDDYDPWGERLPYFKDLFARYDPDLIGTQELAF